MVKNSLHVFDLNSESESDSTNNINVLDSNDNTLVTILVGSSGSSGSHGTSGTPPSELKNTELGSNLYLTPSSGQSERSVSKVSNISADLGPSKIIIV